MDDYRNILYFAAISVDPSATTEGLTVTFSDGRTLSFDYDTLDEWARFCVLKKELRKQIYDFYVGL